MLTMACHCTGCQRMTGGPYSLSAMVAADKFTLMCGNPVEGGLKGSEIDHMFCPQCMSWVFTRVMDGALINLRSPMLDDTAGTEPFIETFTSEKLPWVTTPATFSYDKFPDMDQYTEVMKAYAKQA